MSVAHTDQCRASGCDVPIPPGLPLMCSCHWYEIPAGLRADLWRHYRRGQTDATASPEFRAALEAAIEAVAAAEGRP